MTIVKRARSRPWQRISIGVEIPRKWTFNFALQEFEIFCAGFRGRAPTSHVLCRAASFPISVAKNTSVHSTLIFRENKRRMPVIILCMFRFVRLLSSGHQAIAVENLALRRQLAAFKRKRKKPLLTQWDRLFWVGLSRLWSGCAGYVQPSDGSGSDSASSGPMNGGPHGQ
jgi:hypothetical protein